MSSFGEISGQSFHKNKAPLKYKSKIAHIEYMYIIFRSSHWLPKVECPVLMMHAADDVKVTSDQWSLTTT